MGLTRNSSIVVLGVVISNALAYLFHILVGRALGPAEYGVFGTLLSLFLIIALPAGAISSAITKFTARYNKKGEQSKIGELRDQVFRNVLALGLILFILVLALSIPISDYLKVHAISIIIVGFTLVFALVLPVNRGILQGMKKFKILSFNNILEAVSRLLLAGIFIFIGLKANGAVLAYGLAYLIAFAIIFPYIKETRPEKKLEKQELRSFYKFALLVLLTNLILQLIINLPTIFIKHYSTAEFTGLWTAALTLARVSLFVTGGITLVMFPEVAEKENGKEKRQIFKRALLLVLASSVLIALLFILLGKFVIQILYGAAFLEAFSILEWLTLGMIPLGVLQLWINYWVAGR